MRRARAWPAAADLGERGRRGKSSPPPVVPGVRSRRGSGTVPATSKSPDRLAAGLGPARSRPDRPEELGRPVMQEGPTHQGCLIPFRQDGPAGPDIVLAVLDLAKNRQAPAREQFD